VFQGASFLKLVTTYPLPQTLIRRFALDVKRILVVEELDPFIEDILRAMGMTVMGKEVVPIMGELNPQLLEERAAIAGLIPKPAALYAAKKSVRELPLRPPLLCPGCPHAATSYALKRLAFYHTQPEEESASGRKAVARKRQGIIAASDIGCYTLSVYPPLLALDTCACMGASIGQAHGLEKAGVTNRIVSVIGDSTFLHSGITSLVNTVYNEGRGTTIILDNGTTAMTGHQGHPGTGTSARGDKAPRVVIEDLVRGIGVRDVNIVNAFDLPLIEDTIKRCVETDEPSVIIIRGACPLHVRGKGKPLTIDLAQCDQCFNCLRVGCQAITREGNDIRIDAALCVGDRCAVCSQVCHQKAIRVK